MKKKKKQEILELKNAAETEKIIKRLIFEAEEERENIRKSFEIERNRVQDDAYQATDILLISGNRLVIETLILLLLLFNKYILSHIQFILFSFNLFLFYFVFIYFMFYHILNHVYFCYETHPLQKLFHYVVLTVFHKTVIFIL